MPDLNCSLMPAWDHVHIIIPSFSSSTHSHFLLYSRYHLHVCGRKLAGGGYGGRNSQRIFAYSSLCRIIPYARLGHDYLSSARYSALLDKIRLLSAEDEESGAGVEIRPPGELRWKPPFMLEVRCLKEQGRTMNLSLSLFNIPSPFYRCIKWLVLFFFFPRKQGLSSWEIPKVFFNPLTGQTADRWHWRAWVLFIHFASTMKEVSGCRFVLTKDNYRLVTTAVVC